MSEKIVNKTLIFTLEYPPMHGGVGNYYYNLVKNYPKPDNIFVLNNNNGSLINYHLPFLKWLPAIFKLNGKINKYKITKVLIGNILPLGTACYILSKFKRINFSIIIHGTDIAYAQKKKVKKLQAFLILKNCQEIFCNSCYTKSLINRFYKNKFNDKIKVINPGINREIIVNEKLINNFKNKYNLNDKIVLFSVSRLIRRKGIDKTIEAMPKILKKEPRAIYFIIGDGPDRSYLVDLKNSLPANIKNRIIFLGSLEDDLKWALFSLADIFVMPSREDKGNLEGFGIVYLEANLFGKPVIAGNSGGIGEAVINNKTGFLVNPENIDEITEKIVFLAANSDIRKKMGKAGEKRVLENFNWKTQAEKYYKIINNI